MPWAGGFWETTDRVVASGVGADAGDVDARDLSIGLLSSILPGDETGAFCTGLFTLAKLPSGLRTVTIRNSVLDFSVSLTSAIVTSASFFLSVWTAAAGDAATTVAIFLFNDWK